MNGSRSCQLVLLVAINFLLSGPANAGVVKRSIRMVREVYPPDVEPENEGNQPQVCIVGDVVYGAEETVPAEQPCLKCRCQPPGVQCETVQCAKKPGCKAIHRSNKCCPDYQCECEHNDKIYANGEKLETNPGGECKVCYCRGGEVQCAEVSCYIRNDCEGKRVPGTCCPKYDHCPPIDAVLDRSAVITEAPLKPVIILEPWQEPNNATEVPFNLPITVYSIPEESNKVPDTSDLATASPSYQEIPQKGEGLHPRITIQEIIPERKEIPVTAPPKILISEPQGTLLIEESLPTSENASNDLNFDTEPESSEISEIFQHPFPVLRIGDKLLFLKKGDLVPEKDTTTPDSVITIIGAEGLQRGGVEESLEVHEDKIESNNDVHQEGKILPEISSAHAADNDALETLYEPANLTEEIEDPTNDLELKPAESTHILSLVKRKGQTLTTTSTHSPGSSSTKKDDALTTLTGIIEEPKAQSQGTQSTINAEVTTLAPDVSTTIIAESTEAVTKNTEPSIEQNPAYPPIPDIMPAVGDISQKFEVELESDNFTTMEIKILPEVYDLVSNKTNNNQTHSEWLKTEDTPKRNGSLLDFKAGALPLELLNEKSPIDDEEDDNTTVDSNTATTEGKVVDDSEEKFSLIKEEIIASDSSAEATTTTTATTREQVSSETKLLEEGAQLIAEVKISDGFEDVPMMPPTTATIHSKISEAPANLSIPDNKTDKITPEISSSKGEEDKNVAEAIKEAANSEVVNLNETTKQLINSDTPKFSESIEIDSGEQTTPKTNHSSMISSENASVESDVRKEQHSEINDMTHQISERPGSIELGSVELSDLSLLKDVEMISSAPNTSSVPATTDNNVMKQDVELINVNNTPKPTKLAKIETSTYELLPTPEEAKSRTPSALKKREITSGNSQEDIFKDLERELNADSSYTYKNAAEERAEADHIFKELLEESEGNKKVESKPKSKEQEKIDSLSEALAGITLKGKIPDPDVFRLIGGLFGGHQQN